jgi:tetratricopeptide (TPR) repeat protein
MPFNDISEMIKRILEQDDVPKEFCELVYKKTGGNPFFLEEVVTSLKEEGIIFREENQWKIKEVSRIEFPKTVKGVIKARINRLDDDCQNILTLASFVGNDFTFEALRGIAGVEEDKLLELMEKLLKTGLVKEQVIRGEDVYCFADVIVRDVVHEEVSHLRHRKLHDTVGNALEKVYAQNVDQHFGELAYHFLEAGNKDKALDYFFKAGEKAQKVYAHNEAFSYLQRALALLEEKAAGVEQKVSVVERLGDLKAWMGEYDVCLEYWDKSLTMWDQLGDKKRVAVLHVKMANVFWDAIGDREKATEHHNVALLILEKEPESVELGRLYENICHMLWRTGSAAEASPFANKALKLAEKFGDAETLAECYNDLTAITQSFEESGEYLGKGLKIALENNCMEIAIRLYNNVSLYYEAIGDIQKAVETRQKGFELGKKVGETLSTSWIGRTLAYGYVDMGDLQNALALVDELLALSKRTKNTVGIAQATYLIGQIYRYLGEWDKSFQFLREGYDTATTTGDYQTIGEAAWLLGELFLEMEEDSEAEKYLNEGNSVYERGGNTMVQVYAILPELTRLHLMKGETEKARELTEKIHEYVAREKFRLAIPKAEMLTGMLFREQKNWEQSIQHFEKSLQECKSMNFQKWHVWELAEILSEYGLMYLERNHEGDKEQAYSLLRQALEIYERTDAKKKAEKTRSMMTRAEPAHEMVSEAKPSTKISEGVPSHITTGYAPLDTLLYGGISENCAVVLTATSCDERALLIKRFLEAGIRNGETTFYLATDPSDVKSLAEKLEPSFHLFVCNPYADAMVKSSPNVFKLKGVENLTDISIALTSAIRKLDPSKKHLRRICIGLISDVLLQHQAIQTRRWLAGLIPELRSERFTTLAVMDPGMHAPQEVRAVLDLFEGEINVYEKETEKGLAKYLKIKKMINQKYLESELPLDKDDLKKQE